MMRFAETTAKIKTYTQIRLATQILLAENIDLYLHLGWQEINRIRTKVLMKKEI